jgi:prepilin signal peptidase PulO-like enzyme (type II secretory pathway)
MRLAVHISSQTEAGSMFDPGVIRRIAPSSASGVPAVRQLARLFQLSAVGLFALCLVLSPSGRGAVAGVGLAILAICAAVDLVELRVPNALTYSGTVMVLVVAVLRSEAAGIDAVAGAMVAGGFLLAISLISRGRVGVGDAKLSALGGALVGVNYVLLALFAGTLAAAAIYVSLLLTGRITRTQSLPYAPFLTGGYVVVALITGTTLGL